MISLSVVIITLNEEKNLDRCLQTIKYISDEIVVVDSGSTDKTVEIARRYGARVITQPFLGYVDQKNFATAQAANDWVLSLDADECVSPELEECIKKVKKRPVTAAYRLSRLTNYCGKWIRHSGWYPDKKIRLYDRTRGAWKGDRIHEYWTPDEPGTRIGKMHGDLLHYSYHTLSDHMRQIEKFSEILARRDVEKGKTSSILKVMIAPRWKFFTDFIIRLGFLDGYSGFLVCRMSAFATFMKYSKIRQYSQFKRKGLPF